MAKGGDPYFDNQAFDTNDLDDDEEAPLLSEGKDDAANETKSFRTSTPYQTRGQEKFEKKTMRRDEEPNESYAETKFGGTEEIEIRLCNLRRDHITGLLNTEGIPVVENLLSAVERGREIEE